MWWLTAGTFLFVGLALAWSVSLSPRAVPLGVRVPSAYVDHPVVLDAVAHYRVLAFLITAAFLAVTGLAWLAVGDSMRAATVLLVVGTVAQVVAFMWAIGRSGAPIRAAKAAEGWYDGARVAVVASVTTERDPDARVRWGWHVVSLAVLAAVAGIGAAAYPGLPDRIVTHVGPDGPDAWAAKSVWAVFSPLLFGVVTVVFVAGIAALVARRPLRIMPGGDLEAARADVARRGRFTQLVVGLSNVVVAVTFALVSLVFWFAPEDSLGAASWLIVAVSLVPVAALVALTWRLRGRLDSGGAAGRGPVGPGAPAVGHQAQDSPESPDDDRHWIWGSLYYNPDDPSFLVDKRLGVGMTVNFAHWGGKVFAAVTVALLALTAVLVIVQPGG